MADAIYYSILEAVRDHIRHNLDLAPMGKDRTRKIESRNVTIRKKSDVLKKGIATPAIVLSPRTSMSISATAGTNARDDYAYPVLVQIVDKDHHDQDLNLHTYLKWREQITRAFHHQKLTGVDSVYIGLATSVDYVDDRLWKTHEWFVGGVVLAFVSRLTRGVT